MLCLYCTPSQRETDSKYAAGPRSVYPTAAHVAHFPIALHADVSTPSDVTRQALAMEWREREDIVRNYQDEF